MTDQYDSLFARFVDRALVPNLRRYGTRSYLVGTSGTAVLAGVLSASGIAWSLLGYVAVAVSLTLAMFLSSIVMRPQHRYWLFGAIYRLPKRPELPELIGTNARAAVPAILVSRGQDHVYFSGAPVV